MPASDIPDAFDELCEIEMIPDDFIDYFKRTYLGYKRGRTFKNPLYPIEQWCLHERLRQELPRTNNAAEGYHSMNMKITGGKMHAPLYQSIAMIEKKAQSLHRLNLTSLDLDFRRLS